MRALPHSIKTGEFVLRTVPPKWVQPLKCCVARARSQRRCSALCSKNRTDKFSLKRSFLIYIRIKLDPHAVWPKDKLFRFLIKSDFRLSVMFRGRASIYSLRCCAFMCRCTYVGFAWPARCPRISANLLCSGIEIAILDMLCLFSGGLGGSGGLCQVISRQCTLYIVYMRIFTLRVRQFLLT